MTGAGPVLVTGAFGLVGTATIEQLASEGRRVVATDLKTPAYVKAAKKLPAGVEVKWADLTVQSQLDELLGASSPSAIIHLVGMIAPAIYRNPALGRKVNVDITRALVSAAQALPKPPRIVHASSVAVYGPRNPFRHPEKVDENTVTAPNEVYGSTKLEAEQVIRTSTLDWVILRLGGVVSTRLVSMVSGWDVLLFESALPKNGRIHTVDVRDVAKAFAAATTADAVGRILLIGGDGTHMLRYTDATHDLTAAAGIGNVLPEGRPGDPDSETAWFATDWMDTGPAQELLQFQNHSWGDILAEVRRKVGPARHVLRVVAPLVRNVLERRSAYRDAPGVYADPWEIVREHLGDPAAPKS
ncbi:NAD(P)-dependent oxidoreductase [Mycobacterium sp. E2479]|uniref:NAD-dependent epimerase/dehydratase family protein n=1 Tax=Mycobacterium sp. E2479 TaxID=1834134 RepID=UPI0008018D0B|nr:NAD(P)-dependent oxidoreductase [Mycobacterium sp. E2479]OBH50420.1 oxidoreductase [Mycobacterium sp. E2479]